MDQILKIYERFSKHPHITTDSRKVEQGDIFFALKGDNFNGNKFAATALDAGASFAVIDEEDFFVSADDRYILVEDVLTTLQQLARHHRRTVNPTILAMLFVTHNPLRYFLLNHHCNGRHLWVFQKLEN